MMPEKHKGKPGQEERFHPVDPSEPRLRINTSACLPARSPLADCKACAEACPVSVIAVGDHGPELQGTCLGCGRCAANCPSSALQLHGFPELPLPGQSSPIVNEVDCWRVPESESCADTLRVPCTGGLDAAQLLSLNRLAGANGIAVVDRGWCQDCPAGGGAAHPAAHAVRIATELLGDNPTATQGRPTVRHQPLPQRRATKAIPEAKLERRVSRRGFLRQLGGEAVSARARLAEGMKAPATTPLVNRVVPFRRLRLSAELQALDGYGQGPASLPRLSVSEQCDAHGICAGLCPTGALERRTTAGSSTLSLNGELCIGCRMCERVCPEQAIRVEAMDGGTQEAELHHLTTQRCRDCGQPFGTHEADEAFCPACRKSRQLMRAASSGPTPHTEPTTGEGSR